jgi:hypothetical protein
VGEKLAQPIWTDDSGEVTWSEERYLICLFFADAEIFKRQLF